MHDDATGHTHQLLPLSPLQQGMLFHYLSGEHPGVDVQQIVCRLRQPIEPEVFLRAWQLVADRHPVLRGALRWEGLDEPVMEIYRKARPPLSVHGGEGLTAEERDERIRVFLRKDRRGPIELDVAPLFRISVFEFAEDDARFVLTFHHMMMDGYSTALILRELMAVYEALDAGGAPASTSLSGTRASTTEPVVTETVDLAELEEYWTGALAGLWEPTPVPGDGSGSADLPTGTARYGYVDGRLSTESSERLAAAATRHGFSIAAAVRGAWALLSSRYADVDDVLFGTTLLGRGSGEGEESIGVFINTIPVRVHVPTAETVAEWLGRLRREARQSRQFQHVSLVDVHRWSGVPAGRPLFETLLIFDRRDMTAQLRAADSAWAEREVQVFEQTGYPLTAYAYAEPELQIHLAFDRHRVSESAAQRILDQVLGALERMAAAPETSVGELSILLASEEEALLHGWNETDTAAVSPGAAHEQFERQVGLGPDRVALRCGDETMTYADLNARANALARDLQGRGIGRESIVGILMERGLEMVVAMLGTLKAGAAYLPLDMEHPAERIGFMLSDAGAAMVLTLRDSATGIPTDVWNGDAVDLASTASSEAIPADSTIPANSAIPAGSEDGTGRDPPRETVASDLAYVMYTSGSTGRPKGVMVEHGNVANFFAGMDARVDHDPPGVWLALTSPSFDISVLELLWTLARGFEVVIWREPTGAFAGGRTRPLDMSLFFFAGSEGGADAEDRFRLITEASRFADENGFCAVWTPERHFHAFGGLSPNAAVMAAALATITERVQLRSGSVVLPLHHPVRVAEEWGLVDNLSGGRVGLGVASGWFPNDWVLAVGDGEYEDRNELTFERIELIRRLWRGESCTFPRRDGTPVDVRTFPRPIQPEVPIWVTAAVNPATFVRAGEVGAHVLTHLLGHSLDELAPKIAAYRRAWEEAGHAGRGVVSVMLHTLVGESDEAVLEIAREPMKNYLGTSVDLVHNHLAAVLLFKDTPDIDLNEADAETLGEVLEYSFQRYFYGSSLLGSPTTCLAMIDRLKDADVDEAACFVDFGVDEEVVLSSLDRLDEVRRLANPAPGHGREADSIPDLIRRQGVTHLQCTPSQARLLMHDPAGNMAIRSLDTMLVGGEALPVTLAAALSETVCGRVLNMYGPTETTIWSSTDEILGDPGDVSIGRPIANTRFYVFDSGMRPVPIGAPGELFISGAGVTRGYLNRPGLTRDAFIPNPFEDGSHARLFRTGDRVRYSEDGKLEFLGRRDGQVKIRGHRVELGEIEALLEGHPAIATAVAIVSGDGEGQRLVAYSVPSSKGTAVKPAELRAWLRSRLPEVMIPSAYVSLSALPLTASGKLDRAALPDPDGTTSPVGTQGVEPSTPAERRVARVYEDVIGVDAVGSTDDFFDLGGNSLLAIQISLRIQQEFGVELPLATFSRVSTVAAVAELVEERLVGGADPSVLEELLGELEDLTDQETRSLLAGD